MARIPEEVIERLKEEVSLQRLVELAGVELRRQGKDLVGLCPFHEERTGSLVVSPEKNLWHCMGACRAGGSVIDWVMRAEGVSFRHAVELLRDGVAPSQLGGRRAVRSTVSKLPSPLAVGADAGELLERVAGFYAQTLRESPYLVYYASYYAAKAISGAGCTNSLRPIEPLTCLDSHLVASPLAIPEAVGLAGDVAIDAIKGESICDEGVEGYINPLHSFVPPSLRGPKVYLPGVHPDGSVDFEW